MESFGRLAMSMVGEGPAYDPVGHEIRAMDIASFPSKSTLSDGLALSWNVSRRELWHFLANTNTPNEGEYPEASLKLVHLAFELGRIGIDEDDFQEIFDSFKITPYIRYLIAHQSQGFYHFPRSATSPAANGSASPAEGGEPDCFFLKTTLYVLIWSFDEANLKTRAIFMDLQTSATAVSDNFRNILNHYKNHIYTPYLLAFVACIQAIENAHTRIHNRASLIREIEATTGHGAWKWETPQPVRNKIEEITKNSMEVGSCLEDLANQPGQLEIVRALIAFIEEEQWKRQFEIREICASKAVQDLNAFQAVLPVLKKRIHWTNLRATHILERARVQSSVLLSFLTHEDALVNLELAQATKQLGESAKRDSFSMKTIAVMTMSFLPGTFFAALFAVPSLQWDEPDVVKSSFWIYWACVLPSTFLVFAIWLLVMNWDFVRKFKSGNEAYSKEEC